MRDPKSGQDSIESISKLSNLYIFYKVAMKVNEKIDDKIFDDKFFRLTNIIARTAFIFEFVNRYNFVDFLDVFPKPSRNVDDFSKIVFTSIGTGMLYNFLQKSQSKIFDSCEEDDQKNNKIKKETLQIFRKIKSEHLRSTEQSKQKYLSIITSPQAKLLQDLGNQKIY